MPNTSDTPDIPGAQDFRMTDSVARALAGEPIRIGSGNAAKREAVRRAFSQLLAPSAESRIQGVPVAVESGVPEQPVGFEEIMAGARERARAARASGPCALAVGIEDGLVRLPDGLPLADEAASGFYNVGCAWLTDGTREAAGLSSGFAYPTAPISAAAQAREPIGDLFDALWRAQRDPSASSPSGPRGGNIGKLTGGRLPRADYGAQAVLCALVRFLHKDLYD